MQKDRIVGVLREARGLRKNKSGKVVVGARLGAKSKADEKAQKRQEALRQPMQRLEAKDADRS